MRLLHASPLNASPFDASLAGSIFGPQRNNLAAVVRGFKSASTKRIRAAELDFGWQSRYYDHVIRDERALEEIRKYIASNPMKWEFDKNHPKNLA
jgi:REP-associated tyrosine transposase